MISGNKIGTHTWVKVEGRQPPNRPCYQDGTFFVVAAYNCMRISVIQSTQNTAVFVGRRLGCNERGQSQARQRELGLKCHQLPLPESRASDFPMTHLQASRNTIDSNF